MCIYITTIDSGLHPSPYTDAYDNFGPNIKQQQPTFATPDQMITDLIFPEDTDTDLSDTKQAEEAVRNWVLSEYHPIGSCAVGDALDSRFRVKGVTGLRVVDASVFPNHVSGNCVASVYAVAEKAADLVKEDYSLLCSRMN